MRLAKLSAGRATAAMPRRITVALAGNPNSGKTTIFNNLTGARHHVGNDPGVTAEKKSGTCNHRPTRMDVVDLPGTLRAHLRENDTSLQAFCIMLFCLVRAPCMATIAVTRRESNSWRWAFLQLGGLTVLAFMLTTIVYQVGSLLTQAVARTA